MFNKFDSPSTGPNFLQSSASWKMSGAHLSADCEKRSVKYGNPTGAMATRLPKDCRASGIRKKQLTH